MSIRYCKYMYLCVKQQAKQTNENYKFLNSNMSQQILKEVDGAFKEIRIVPKHNARFFEVQYTYKVAEIQRSIVSAAKESNEAYTKQKAETDFVTLINSRRNK